MALELKPPLRIEISILLEQAEALSEWFRPAASGGPLWSPHISTRLDLMEKTLVRLRQLLSVPDPFDLAVREGWCENGQELVFDPNTYFREDEKEEALRFVDWCENLSKTLRIAFKRT